MITKRLDFFTLLISGIFLTVLFPATASADRARELVEQVVEAVGGTEAFYGKKDVEYTYLYRNRPKGKIDLSIERYIFDGEHSWAEYSVHETFGENISSNLVQVFDGQKTKVYAGGKRIRNKELVARADFLRKTNYYWFAMMYKLLDPGTILSFEGRERVNGISYDKVRLTFKPGVGDVSDIYLLYVNTKTKLVDQFLFTVMDFGRKDPLLMEVRYGEVEGLRLPTFRRYMKSNWKGEKLGEDWVDEISVNVKFNNGFKPADFK